MKAMVLSRPGPIESAPLRLTELPIPEPGLGEILIQVEVCGVCRTDLHVTEGDLPPHRQPIIPGHEIVGRVVKNGPVSQRFRVGDRVGVAWLGGTDGTCAYCRRGDENLCDAPEFTGYDRNGGYAEYTVAHEDFAYPLAGAVSPEEAAPFLCAGIIGYRSLERAELPVGAPLGLYGFGASAHILIQIARHRGSDVYVCTREERHQALALELGAVWAGGADAVPPVKLRSSILFAPAGPLVLPALAALDKGGTLSLAGIYMTPIPEMDYMRYLFQEHTVRSVTANTRSDGQALLKLAAEIPLHTQTTEFALEQANQALQALKHDQINGAAVLRISAG
ncbi:MAG: zinc-dependent alcohol dehydrogenase family protein [Janthinobacterium lividum]